MPAAAVAVAVEAAVVVAAAAVVVAAVSLAARAEAAALNDHRAPSLRSARPQGALPQRRHPRRGLKDATKLSPKMRAKREFPVLPQLSL